MAASHLLSFSLLTLFLTPSLSNPSDFSPNLAVYGGATFSPTAVLLPNPSLLILKTPLSFLTPTSFSTHFSFSLSPHSTLSLLLFPTTFLNKTIENSIHLKVEFSSDSVRIRHASVKLNPGGRQRVEAFVDYRAGAKSLEVRLGEPETDRPVIAFPIDLSEMWKGEGVLVGLESEWNSSVVHSWRFWARIVPKGMHSRPLDPRARSREGSCYLTVASAVMIATGVSVFVVFMVMFFRVVTTDWEEVMEMEYVLKPVGNGYEKVVSVDVENNMCGNVKC